MVRKCLFVGFCLLILVINTITYAAESELTLDTSDSNSAFSVKNSLGEPVMSSRGDGNVGIGTTSPDAKLHIGGTPGVDGIKFPDGTTQTTAAATDSDPTSFFEVYLSGNQTFRYTPTKFNWALEDSDTNNEFDLGDDRFTVKVAGMYLLQAAATMTASMSRDSRVQLRKNGTIIVEHISHPAATGGSSTNSFSIMVDANVGDYFEVWGREMTEDGRVAYGAKHYTYFKGYRLK